MSRALFLAIVLTFAPAASPGSAQTAEELVVDLSEENARLYIQPVTSGLAAALNTGNFHAAKVHRPWAFDVGFRVMGAFAPAGAEWYRPVLPASVTYRGRKIHDPYEPAGEELRSPTPMGSGSGMLVVPGGEFLEALLDDDRNPDDYAYRMPGGVGLPAVPFVVLQFSMGLPGETEVRARLTPRIGLGKDVGAIAMVGAGVQHSLEAWLPPTGPFTFSISAGLQRLLGDHLRLTARHAALVAGADAGAFSLYAAAGLEGAAADVEYRIERIRRAPGLPPGALVVFRQSAESTPRVTGGATLSVAPVLLNAEYSVARYPVASAKLMLGL